MESEGMLRHLVFFEELGKMDETDPSWRAVSAGLVTMRLVDQWIADGPSASRVDSWSVSGVREAIAQVAETTPIRRMLSAIVDVMVGSRAVDLHALMPRLMAYGQALEYEARWALAVDVYELIVAHANPDEDADIVVSAYIQMAFSRRTMGDLDGSARAYAGASHVAHAAGDIIGVLRGRLGDAKIAMAKGNLPQAEQILEETIERAGANGLDDLKSRALNDRAFVAGSGGRHDRAVRYSYAALELSKSPRERDRILINIATGLRHLGLNGASRDAYLVLVATAQEQYIRWMSELHLMELAAFDHMELQFDRYRRDLESADFTPQLRVTYLIHVGRGYGALGRSELGIPYLERAVELASTKALNHLLFEAEGALAEARRRDRVPAPAASVDAPDGVENVVDAIRTMKEMAGIA